MQINNNNQSRKVFDLEERTLVFAINVINLCKSTSINIYTENSIQQLLRSSSSIGANYREANDSLGKKDFFLRIKTSRKEAKETLYWLSYLETFVEKENVAALKKECQELIYIFSSIAKKQ